MNRLADQLVQSLRPFTCVFADEPYTGRPRLEIGSTKQILVGSAMRCMHEMCWFAPARAYELKVYVDEFHLNRSLLKNVRDPSTASASESSPKVASESSLKPHVDSILAASAPKTFELFFTNSKDAGHVRNGLRKSLEKANASADSINGILSLLPNSGNIAKGASLMFTCSPRDNGVIISYEGKSVVIQPASTLIEALHGLYLNETCRYKGIRSTIQQSALELVTKERTGIV